MVTAPICSLVTIDAASAAGKNIIGFIDEMAFCRAITSQLNSNPFGFHFH
jgi:hypothetical protein